MIDEETILKLKKVLDDEIKRKGLKFFNKDLFKFINIISVDEWKNLVLTGKLIESKDYPPISYQKKGEIYFIKDILVEVENRVENKIVFLEVLSSYLLHELIHVYLGHQGGEGDYAENLVNQIAAIYFRDLFETFAKNFQWTENICEQYRIER